MDTADQVQGINNQQMNSHKYHEGGATQEPLRLGVLFDDFVAGDVGRARQLHAVLSNKSL
jgi:hypothetical protein